MGYRCAICGCILEQREIHIEGTTAVRLYCSKCKKTFTEERVCDVCHRAFESQMMGATLHQSRILGNYMIRHCSDCHPPSKIALEFQTAPIAAFCKYSIVYGLPLLCLIITLIALLSGTN